MKTTASAGIATSEIGETIINICLGDGKMIEHTQMTPVAAAQLMYDLHSALQTLRGIKKPLPFRDRPRRVFAGLRGH